MKLFDEVGGLEHVLDYHLQRHGVLASNLANADTPNYVARDVVFRDALDTASMRTTDDQHINPNAGRDGYAVAEQVMEPHHDGSGVEIEQAMAQVMGNRLRYETGIELARRRLAQLRYAAGDGSGG